MSDLIKRIDESAVIWRNYQLSALLDDCKAEIIRLDHTKTALDHACALVEDELAKSKAEIQRLLLANETLTALNAEYAERVKALEAKGEAVAWMVDTEHYGTGFSFSDKLLEAFPNFPTPPSVDALIAEIDALCFDEASGGYFWPESINPSALKEICDKYRSAK